MDTYMEELQILKNIQQSLFGLDECELESDIDESSDLLEIVN